MSATNPEFDNQLALAHDYVKALRKDLEQADLPLHLALVEVHLECAQHQLNSAVQLIRREENAATRGRVIRWENTK